MRRLGLLGLLTLPASCGGAGSGDYCLAARPIYISRDDVLTVETARAILAANETGARLCGWQPSRRAGTD
jgi:hypothetical protein